MNTTLRIGAAIVAVLLLTTAAYARGSCDGFTRCRCGTTAARHFGLPYNFNGHNMKLAWTWAQVFPHTSFHVGAAGVVHHHVLAITGGSDCAHAMVHDDAGDYQRNVCHMTFVDVAGGRATVEASAVPHHRRGRHHRGHGESMMASYEAQDRLSAH